MTFSESGIVVIDKPQGITSHDVVAKVRKKLGTRKVGHAGTLDPMATGVLVLGVNQATRLLDFIVAGIKEYEATVRLGQTTVSDDADGEIVAESDASKLEDADIFATFAKYQGKISQLPSKVSAKKVDGKRAHALVREGVEFELKAKEVEIFEMSVGEISRSGKCVDVKIRVKCSTGTYIRSIARDAGIDLNVGGHLIALRRTLVEPFGISAAQNIDADLKLVDLYESTTRVLPSFEIDIETAQEVTFGKPLSANKVEHVGVSAITFRGQVLAIVEKLHDDQISYRAVLATKLAD